MAVSFTPGNDFIIPTANGQTYLGGAGDDTYILSSLTIEANATIAIQDTEGSNKIQLVDGLQIASSMVTSNAVQLTLNNGAKIQILGADSFGYDVGGNSLATGPGTQTNFNSFVSQVLGSSVPGAGQGPASSGPVTIDINMPITDDNGNGGNGDPQAEEVSADIGTVEARATLDAGGDSFIFTDDASVASFVDIDNFTEDDQIQISNLPAGAEYSFVNDGTNVDITYNNNDDGTINHIRLLGVGSESFDLFDDAAGFEAAIGFDAVAFV